jgi:decaprenylphospho-beta-D-erythro-pentofuranosid-2-ulose 2-reductase
VVADAVGCHGDVDVAIVAFGQLGDGKLTDVIAAMDLVTVNVAGAVASCIAVANRMRHQGHGTLIVLSSVAGVRVRKANALYGATKAGLDGFALGLADDLHGSGVRVVVVRPGFVHSAMTAGMKAAPFATTPAKVAEATVKGMRSNARVVWVPSILRLLFAGFQTLPASIWRKMPG